MIFVPWELRWINITQENTSKNLDATFPGTLTFSDKLWLKKLTMCQTISRFGTNIVVLIVLCHFVVAKPNETDGISKQQRLLKENWNTSIEEIQQRLDSHIKIRKPDFGPRILVFPQDPSDECDRKISFQRNMKCNPSELDKELLICYCRESKTEVN